MRRVCDKQVVTDCELLVFFFQAEDGIRYRNVTGVQTCALPIYPEDWVSKKDVKKMDLFIHYAMAASDIALKDAAYSVAPSEADRVGVYIGSGIGGLPSIERQHATLLQEGPRRISPFFIVGLIVNMASGQVSIRYGAKGPNQACCTACATGTHAIGDAFEIIKRNDADVMIAGGCEGV